MQYRIDFKNKIESITSLKVYPVIIPNKTKYPAIQLEMFGGGRDSDSSTTDTRIGNHRISITVCAADLTVCYEKEQLLKDALDGKPFDEGSTKALIMYFENSVELHNYSQNLYELTIDFSIKKIN